MKNKVIDFSEKVAQLKKAEATETRAVCGGDEVTEYHISSIMAAVSWALQMGDVKTGEKLFSASRASGHAEWTALPPELVEVVDTADLGIGMFGASST